MPEFEKPRKQPHVLIIEGCLLLILFGMVAAAVIAIAIEIYNRLLG